MQLLMDQRGPFRVISHLAINLANSGCELPVIIMMSDDEWSSMVANLLGHTHKTQPQLSELNQISKNVG